MSNDKKNTKDSSKKSGAKMTAKRIAALICVILLVSLYVITLLVAIFDRSSSGRWFFICMIATLFIPILCWIYIWMYGLLTNKHTIASFDVRDHSKDQAQASSEDSADQSKN